jgi:hypothetical protein
MSAFASFRAASSTPKLLVPISYKQPTVADVATTASAADKGSCVAKNVNTVAVSDTRPPSSTVDYGSSFHTTGNPVVTDANDDDSHSNSSNHDSDNGKSSISPLHVQNTMMDTSLSRNSSKSTEHSFVLDSSATTDPQATIRMMDTQTIHRIVAGQAVTDLASAVKELIDNSLDASATRINSKLKCLWWYHIDSFSLLLMLLVLYWWAFTLNSRVS